MRKRWYISVFACCLALLWSAPALAKRQVQMPPPNSRVVASQGSLGLSFGIVGISSLIGTPGNVSTIGSANVFNLGLDIWLQDKLSLGLIFGLGLTSTRNPVGADRANDFGLNLGGGLAFYFAQWKHINAYVGGDLLFGVAARNGQDAGIIFQLVPKVGVQWFFTHLLSLSAEFLLPLNFIVAGGELSQMTFGTSAAVGGNLKLTVYWK